MKETQTPPKSQHKWSQLRPKHTITLRHFTVTDVTRVKILSLRVLLLRKLSLKFLITFSWFYLTSRRKIITNFSKTKEQCRHLNCCTDAFPVSCFQMRTNTDGSNYIFEAMIAFLSRAAFGAWFTSISLVLINLNIIQDVQDITVSVAGYR